MLASVRKMNDFLLQAEPGFGEWEQFPVKTLQPVMITDSAPTSRPINIPVSSPAESDRMFDSITYDKGILHNLNQLTVNLFNSLNSLTPFSTGSCIIRMMASVMGEATFKRAMQLYVSRM